MPLDPERLTERQRRVLACMQKGLSDYEIAAKLHMGRGNVRSAMQQIAEHERGCFTTSERVARARDHEERLSAAARCARCHLLEPHECLPKQPETRRGE